MVKPVSLKGAQGGRFSSGIDVFVSNTSAWGNL